MRNYGWDFSRLYKNDFEIHCFDYNSLRRNLTSTKEKKSFIAGVTLAAYILWLDYYGWMTKSAFYYSKLCCNIKINLSSDK